MIKTRWGQSAVEITKAEFTKPFGIVAQFKWVNTGGICKFVRPWGLVATGGFRELELAIFRAMA